MFGHKWEPAQGTIVAAQAESPGPAGPAGTADRVYVVDVRKSGGARLRAHVRALPAMDSDLPAGTAVRVEVNAKTDEVRFADNPVVRVGASPAVSGSARLKLGPGTRVVAGTTEVRVTGGTAEVRVVGGTAEIQVTRSAGPPRPADAPSTFDPVPQPPSAVPPAAAAFGGPASSPSFGPAVADSFGSAGSFGSSFTGSSFDSFGESKSDRIAALEDQQDRGRLTEEEFRTRRQQIMDEF